MTTPGHVLYLKKLNKMLSCDLSKDIKIKIPSINGKIHGIIKMLDEDTHHEKTLIKLKAAQQSLDKAAFYCYVKLTGKRWP